MYLFLDVDGHCGKMGLLTAEGSQFNAHFPSVRGFNTLRRAVRYALLSPVHIVQPTSYAGGRILSRGYQETSIYPLCVPNPLLGNGDKSLG